MICASRSLPNPSIWLQKLASARDARSLAGHTGLPVYLEAPVLLSERQSDAAGFDFGPDIILASVVAANGLFFDPIPQHRGRLDHR